MYDVKKIAIYCGATFGNDPVYAAAAKNLGSYLGGNGITVVYGGTDVGLMGTVANAALEAGGDVIGVLPGMIKDKGMAHPGLNELYIVESFEERKAMMAELSDAYIALPGGLGTLDEIIEVWHMSKLSLHEKPAGFLNVNNYYDHLKIFLEHAVAEGFVRPEHYAQIVKIDESPEKLVEFFKTYQHPAPFWSTQEEIDKAKVI